MLLNERHSTVSLVYHVTKLERSVSTRKTFIITSCSRLLFFFFFFFLIIISFKIPKENVVANVGRVMDAMSNMT